MSRWSMSSWPRESADWTPLARLAEHQNATADASRSWSTTAASLAAHVRKGSVQVGSERHHTVRWNLRGLQQIPQAGARQGMRADDTYQPQEAAMAQRTQGPRVGSRQPGERRERHLACEEQRAAKDHPIESFHERPPEMRDTGS